MTTDELLAGLGRPRDLEAEDQAGPTWIAGTMNGTTLLTNIAPAVAPEPKEPEE